MSAFSRRSFVAGLGGTALLAAASERGSAATALHAGVTSDDGYEAWFAQEIGLFAKAGLDVNSQLFANGSAAAAALIGHSLDFACGNVVTVAQARDHGVPVTLVTPSIVSVATAANTGLTVAMDSPIRTAKDLEGKTVGVLSIQGILAMSIQLWLDKNGADSKRVQLVEITPPQMLAALQRGTVAATLMVDPFLTVYVTNASAPAVQPGGSRSGPDNASPRAGLQRPTGLRRTNPPQKPTPTSWLPRRAGQTT